MQEREKPSRKNKRWTDDELVYLASSYGHTTAREIAKYLGRTRTSVYRMADRLGIIKKTSEKWTEDEDSIVAANLEMLASELAKYMDRTESAIDTRKKRIKWLLQNESRTNIVDRPAA